MERENNRCDYEFDCPRFGDFNNLSDEDTEGIDEWFDVNHEEDHEEEQQQFADAVSAQPPTSTSSGTVDSVKMEKPDTEEEMEQEDDHTETAAQTVPVPRCVKMEKTETEAGHEVAVKTEPRSSEDDTAKEPCVQPASLHQEPRVKEEPMSTETEDEQTDTEKTETNQHIHDGMAVMQEKSSDDAETVDQEQDAEMAPAQSDTGEEQSTSSTENKSETESSEQSRRVTPRKRTSTPRKKASTPRSLRRSKRRSQPSNMVTSWAHRQKSGTTTSNNGQSHTRRSTPPMVPSAASLKSTEQMELERIQAAKQALEKTRAMSQQSLKMVRASHSYKPRRSQQPPTRPHGFHFQTDDRLQTAKDQLQKEAEMDKQRQAARKRLRPRPVIKAPLLTSLRKRVTDPMSHRPTRKTFALKVAEFHNKTPDRFHSKPVYEQNKGPCPPTKAPRMGVTIPMSPALKSKTRKRAVTAISTAEKEEMELEEIKKYKFKANPNPNPGCSRANTSGSTISSKASREDEEDKFEFHARAVPRGILEGVTGVGEAKKLPITCPKSPAFALKNRVRPKEPEPLKEDESDKIKARPLPHLGIPFRPMLDHRTTNPEPFSFEDRDRESQVKKEAKVQELYKQEQEARVFHATPAPDSAESNHLPVKKVKPTTKLEPFNIDHDGAKRAEKWAEEVQRELEDQKKRCSSFKAKPAAVLYQEPFVPEKTNRPLTDISDFTLNTEKRAVDREDFERYKYEMEMRKLAEEERQRQQEEEEARQEVARLRQEAVHRAQPVHHFKGVKVQPSDKPLTVAESPRFTDRRRSKAVDQ